MHERGAFCREYHICLMKDVFVNFSLSASLHKDFANFQTQAVFSRE